MTLDYHEIRAALCESMLVEPGNPNPEGEWNPLAFPTWWTWLCENAERIVSGIERRGKWGCKMVSSRDERESWCTERVNTLTVPQVMTIYGEIMADGKDRQLDLCCQWDVRESPEESARGCIVTAMGRVLDALILELYPDDE